MDTGAKTLTLLILIFLAINLAILISITMYAIRDANDEIRLDILDALDGLGKSGVFPFTLLPFHLVTWMFRNKVVAQINAGIITIMRKLW